MKISAIRLHNVRKFAGKGVALENIREGVNVFCAANEHGKSTSFEALRALFFQPHTSASKDIKSLQPYSGGSPLVQADIDTGKGRYRLTKRFLSGRTARVIDLDRGRLVAQADEAENFIADLVKSGNAAPAGLLWVRQGVTGLEPRDKKSEDDEKRIRETLLTSVQGEVEAITGGRRMAAIIAECSKELDELISEAQKRPRGPYDEALKERDRLAALEADLRAKVIQLRQELDQRVQVQKRLTVLDDPEEEAARRSAVEKATTAFQAARAHEQTLKAAESDAKLTQAQLEAAEGAFTAFREAKKRAGELAAALAAVEKERQAAQDRRNQAAEAMNQALAEAQATEAEEREARELLERLDAALKAREAARELAALKERLQQAEAIRAQHEALAAELDTITLPGGLVDELRTLEVELAGLRAAKEASLPTVRMQYRDGAIISVAVGGKRLEHGEERSFEDTLEVDIEGAGTLVLRSNRSADADTKLNRKEEERRKLLQSANVADLAEAQAREARSQSIRSDLRQLELQLKHLAPEGLAKLRAEIAQREALGASVPEVEGDPDAARARATEAAKKLAEAYARYRQLQPQQDGASQTVVEIERRRTAILTELAQVESLLGPVEQREERERALEASFVERREAFERASANVERLRLSAPDFASAEAALKRAQSALEAANGERTTLREKLAALNSRISSLADEAVEEAWRETQEALALANARAERFEREIKVLVRLRNALMQSRSTARDLYLQPVIRELKPLLGLLLQDFSIEFDENTLLPQALRRNGQEEQVEALSGGMKEQLSILTRLAFARMLAANGRPVPVILDDALVYSDDDRIEKMFDALHRHAPEQQIIVFSCRQRAFSQLGGNVLTMTDWQPEV